MSNKYHAQKADYNGVKYDSKLEAQVAQRLDELRPKLDDDTPHVLAWYRQVEFKLIPKYRKERVITYKADFLVEVEKGEDTDTYIIEVKGYDTAVWRLKRRQFLHLYPEAELRVVRSVPDVNRAILENWYE